MLMPFGISKKAGSIAYKYAFVSDCKFHIAMQEKSLDIYF